ncbi:WD40/YVTN/BNR-like repeat-containing protein [Sphaerotilaceae bacterium SBD11-9]
MNSHRSGSHTHRAALPLINAFALTALLGLAACGGGGGTDSSSTTQAPKMSALASVSIEADGSHCPNGGNAINAGMDTNGNGVLDTAEITSVSYVCNGTNGVAGAAGAPGVSTLLQMLPESAGSNCADGGSRINAGRDTNGNAVLDASEVTVTSYVCGGAPGVAGTPGASSLMNVVAEPPGTNCPTGGVRIASGLDGSGDGALQPGEVSSSQYVCQGATGAAGATGASGAAGLSVLIATVSEPASSNCLHGGTRITSGQDANRNSVLDAAEVSATSYVCNGPGIYWSNVNTAAVQGVSNAGYLVQTAARATVTLPANPAVGDIVRVSGIGSGGWQIGQNAGQSIITRGVPSAAAFTPSESSRNWIAAASSADGVTLAAVEYGGQIYVSNDAGVTWAARASVRNWSGIASSADGSRLVAVATGDYIYTSADAGLTWTPTGSQQSWIRVASSADGNKLVAVANNGQIYTSADEGQTWTARESNRAWFSVASSADGHMLAAVVLNGQIYTSADAGLTWTPRETNRAWLSIASSADGSKLVAGSMGGQLYTSSDGGVSWMPRGVFGSWISVASSADGTRLAAAFSAERLYTSIDSGVTWTARDSFRSWEAIASSADGNKLLAAEQGGRLYTSINGMTTPGPLGWLLGDQYDAIELQFIGDGVFIPLSFTNGSYRGITGN